MTTRSAVLAALSFVVAAPSLAQAQRYEWREVQPAVRPTGRVNPSMAYDQARGVVLLFGGHTGSTGNPDRLLNDTWQYDGTNWTELHPATTPPPRELAAMAYDPIRERVVLIGGVIFAPGTTGDTWEWDGNDWTQFGSYNPSLMGGGGACYDPSLGGVLFSHGTTNMVWNGASWRYLSVPNPNSATRIKMVYNAVLGGPIACLLPQRVTMRFNLATGWTGIWTPLPSAGYDVSMACDAVSGRMVLAGDSGHLSVGPTWISEGGGWFLSTEMIPGRDDPAIVFDSDRRRFVLFGGGYGNSSIHAYRDDTWELRAYDQLASHLPYGQGCGTPPAQLAPDPLFGQRPIVGGHLSMIATQVPPGQPFIHCLGTSDAFWLGQPLPFDLAPIGAPGCSILAAPEIIESVGASSAAGDLRFTIQVPDDLRLVGAQFFHQLVGLAPGLNSVGLIVTNGGAGTIGVR